MRYAAGPVVSCALHPKGGSELSAGTVCILFLVFSTSPGDLHLLHALSVLGTRGLRFVETDLTHRVAMSIVVGRVGDDPSFVS